MKTASIRAAISQRPSLGSLLRERARRTPQWKTPHRWADSGGLFATDTDAWLYHELPLRALRPGSDGRTSLDLLLVDLARQRPGRDVHLVMHAWEEQASAPAGTPGELAEYMTGALTFFVPTRRLLIGLRLDKSPEAEANESRVVRSAVRSLDRALGEFVPDLEAWQADRDGVLAILARHDAVPPTAATSAHLESWYTLGASIDVEADDRDEVIALDEANVVEVAAVAALHANVVGAGADNEALMSAGRRGATVASVRGRLVASSSHVNSAREDVDGTLTGVSVVLGRRSEYAVAPWPVTLRRFGAMEQRPLPMRQMAGLDETLPCSAERVSPSLNRVRSAHLAQVGFTDMLRTGDDVGAFVGLASPDFTYPFYLNPASADAPVTLVTGAGGSGKTFLAENVAVQCALAGQRVLYLTTSRSGGAGLRELLPAQDVPVSEPGAFSPYRFLPPSAASELTEQVLSMLVPDLSADEQQDLRTGFRRAATVSATSLDRALALADGTTGVAKLRRAMKTSPYVAAALAAGDGAASPLTGTQVVDLSWFLPLVDEVGESSEPESDIVNVVVDLAMALLIRHAASTPTGAGTLVVLDGAGIALTGPLTAAALAQLRTDSGVHVLLTTALTQSAATSPVRTHVGRTFVLAEDDATNAAAALSLVGMSDDPDRRQWLADARAIVHDEVVRRPALAVHRDVRGRATSVLVGPVPPLALPALTRGRASAYVTGD